MRLGGFLYVFAEFFNTAHVKCEYGAYFFPIAISKFTRADSPCIQINVNHVAVSAMLDLGFCGQFAFSSELLSRITEKKYLRIEKMYGVRGNSYDENLYEIPSIQIGPMSFSHPILHEYSEQFHQDSTLARNEGELSKAEPGKVGWELFGNTNLFLDLGNSKIAFCDSLSTLETQGYQIANFIKTPLFIDRGVLEFEATLSDGPLLCMLDTGATCSILNTDLVGDASVDLAVKDPDNRLNCAVFQIDCKDFGPIAFHRIPINIPIRIEAILGMDFFREHGLC